MSRGITPQRFRTIMERQLPRRFGPKYIPSIFATREEAPSKSRPAKIRSLRFQRRLHALSEPELYAFFLATYHPKVFEIQEQRMLDRFEAPHPMFGMPGVDATSLPSVRGTVIVADQLNCLDLHPTVRMERENDQTLVDRAYPLVGDALLFIDEGPKPYCINWNIKDVDSAFSDAKIKGDIPTKKQRDWAVMRPLIEKEFFADAEIRTVNVSLERIDKEVRRNLTKLAIKGEQKYVIEEEIESSLIDALVDSIERQIPPLEVFLVFARRGLCTLETAKLIMYRAIWNRKMRPDLYHAILEDYPLRPERRDLLEVYAEWFQE